VSFKGDSSHTGLYPNAMGMVMINHSQYVTMSKTAIDDFNRPSAVNTLMACRNMFRLKPHMEDNAISEGSFLPSFTYPSKSALSARH
jgi:hypothetical protein